MEPAEDTRLAARLVYKGLSPRAHPQQDREYRELIRRWLAEPGFRELAQAIAEGLELALLDVSENGVVLAPQDGDSRFAMGLSEYRRSLARDGHKLERGTIAVLQAGVAAAFFPTAATLDDPDEAVETVRLGDIREVVLSLCNRLVELQEGDAEAMPVVLRGAWDQLLTLPVHQHDAKRASLSSLDGALQLVLNQLREQGLVQYEEGSDGGFYFPSRRYRLLLARHAASGLFALCHQLATGRDEVR
jgi:hypothetical protein